MAKTRRAATSQAEGECLFCRIVAGHAEAQIVFQDGVALAFLDTRPLFPGHCLLIPRTHYESLLDLPQQLVSDLFVRAQLLAKAVQEAMQADGSFVAANNRISQSVPHFHIHVVPRRRGDGLRGFFWPRCSYKSQEEMAEVQRALSVRLKLLTQDLRDCDCGG
jgi:histidine triad (HIT) family protein